MGSFNSGRAQAERDKATKRTNIFLKGRNRNKYADNMSKSEKLNKGVGVWTSFYRANPHRFVGDFFNIKLKVFQQILLMMMMKNHYFMYFASRGQGKTFLTAIYILVRAILFPESKIVIAAGQRSQSIEVIEKIKEILTNAPLVEREITDVRTGFTNAGVDFHNGSWIKTVTANDGARGARANVLIVDEFRMVDWNVISTVLRKFLTAERRPKYLDKPEYEHLAERNQELYLSSAWYKHHWSYTRFKTYAKGMAEGKKYFVAGLPYQLAIKENLLNREQVLDEFEEDDFDITMFEMEMESLFFGESEKAFFKYEDIEPNRVIQKAFYPNHVHSLIKDKLIKKQSKGTGEIRLLTADIATMAGKENDASIFSIIRLIPNGMSYIREITYMESLEGGHTESQAIRLKEMYGEFDADFLVIDTMGGGIGVYDALIRPLFDREKGIQYESWTCINDKDMAERCTDPNAKEVIYSVKATAAMNSEMAISFKDGLTKGTIRLLAQENDAKSMLRGIKGYNSLPDETKVMLEYPYIQTTLLANEMINLEGERTDRGLVKLREQRSGRKDRYSSVSYGNMIANELERELIQKGYIDGQEDEVMMFFSG